jgi:hypothetical protein
VLGRWDWHQDDGSWCHASVMLLSGPGAQHPGNGMTLTGVAGASLCCQRENLMTGQCTALQPLRKSRQASHRWV